MPGGVSQLDSSCMRNSDPFYGIYITYNLDLQSVRPKEGFPLVQEPILQLFGIFPSSSSLLFLYCFCRPHDQTDHEVHSDCVWLVELEAEGL